ncbi:MAG: metallophosphoesterase family protein [Proteobacteria bacterium]|nr:metallophosphoesterase family protein [Pseudomonadota bacterium]
MPDQKTNDELFLGRWPSKLEPWPRERGLWVGPENDQDDFPQALIRQYTSDKMWTWTGRNLFFMCDIHADADAFFLSLLGGGAIVMTGPADEDFELTDLGRESRFIIGGDCFDKGPNNLRLLEAIHQLYLKGADLVLLAGNHDIRTYLGIFYAESKDPLLDHLFVRMGKKTVPLLKEIFDKFVSKKDGRVSQLDPTIHNLLFPDESWYEQFPKVASRWVRPEKLDKELRRIREKTVEFEARARDFGMNMAQVYAATSKFRELFFSPDGRYHWFFDKMKLAHREGSYLFVHAGMDDVASEIILKGSVEELNRQFHEALANDPFDLYHGILGNAFRTKYREFDYDFTPQGVDCLHRAGLYAIVHGHRNICQGQRVLIREGMLNFECDASVDSHTRHLEGLYGPGGAVVVFTPEGRVLGLSTDYPYIKSFHPGNITIFRDDNEFADNTSRGLG